MQEIGCLVPSNLKELYYTKTTIAARSAQFLADIQFFRQKHPKSKFDISKCALLVLDMQDFFLQKQSHAHIPSMPAIVQSIQQLQDHFLRQGSLVLQTRHMNTRQNCGRMYSWWGSLLEDTDPLNNIIPDIQHPKIQILLKTQYDAFWQTDLQALLETKGISQVVVTGVMTHLCCETTARAAFVRGYEVFFAIDGTATYNSKFHSGTLMNLAHGFALPVMKDEVLRGFI